MPKKDSVLKIEFNPKAKASSNSSSILTIVSSGQSNPINNLYLLRDGSYSMTGNLNMGNKNIINVGLVDGIDISAHVDNANIHIDHSSLLLNAGVGLTGGGNLTTSKTLSLGTPGTIDVSSENLSTGTTHYHTITHSNNPIQTSKLLSTNANGELTLYKLFITNELFTPTIKSSSSIVLSPNSANVLPEGSVLKDLGDYNRKWRSLFAAELIVENLVAQNVIATIGGRILVAPTTKLLENVSTSSSTIDVEHNIFSLNDYIYLATAPNGIAQIESMRINSSSTVITGGYRFSVIRNVDGTVANEWSAGDAVVLLREGYIDITSTSTILNHLGPTITIYSRNSFNSWNDFYATVAQGNLRSFVDYSTNVFGIGIGNNLLLTPEQGFIGATVDSTNGLRLFNTPLKMFNGNTQTVAINAHNDIWIGPNSSDKKMVWNGTTLSITGTINVTGGNAALTNLSNSVISTIITGNSIQVGSGNKDSTLSGWNISSSEIVGQLSGVDEVILGTNGKISAGQGNVILSRLGIDLQTYSVLPLQPDPTNNIFAIAWWPDPSNIGAQDRPVARIWGGTGVNAGKFLQIDVDPDDQNTGPKMWLQDGGVTQRYFSLSNVDIVTGIPGFSASNSSVIIGSTLQGFQGIGILSNIYAQNNNINVGTSANPFGNVYANRFISTTINGVRSQIGDPGNTFSTIYVDNVVASSITSSTQLSGQIWYFDENADMAIRHNYNGPKTLYVSNQNSNNVMHLDVEGNITLGGNILLTGTVDGVDVSFHANDVNAHHARSHSLTSSNDHTATNLTPGQVIRASTDSTFSWAQLAHNDLSGIGTNSHDSIDSHISSATGHGATGSVVGTTNTQTLTNKTLTTPIISDFSSATHSHTNATSGGTLSHSNLTSLNSDDHLQYYNQTRGDSRYALNSITLTAGNGLTGGGDLTTSRTFNVGAGTMITVGTDTVGLSSGTEQYQIPVTGVATNYTPSWTNLSNFAGDGLTFSTGAFQIVAGDGLTVSANSIALTTPGGLSAATLNSSSSNHTHSISTGSASTLSVSSSNSAGSSSALARADHIHTITTSSSVTNASILASNSSGGLGLQSLTIAANTILQNNQLTTTSGNLSIASSGNILLEPTGSLVSLTSTKSFRSTTYVSGFTGTSWSLDGGNDSIFEVDNLSVRGSLRVYELLIQQIRATNGSLFITSSAKIEKITGTGPYNLTVEGKAVDTQPFAVGDIIRAQRIEIGSTDLIFRSDMTVTAINVGGAARVFTATLLANSNPPQIGYEYVRLGNTTNSSRQGTIYLTSDDTSSPFIDIVTDITSHSDWNTVGKVKMRMGRLSGITGNTNEFGIFAGDGYGFGKRNLIASNNNISLQNVPINFGFGASVGSMASNGNINWKDSANSTIVSINGKPVSTGNSSLTIETLTGNSSYISLITKNVGIGTQTPQAPLHVIAANSSDNALIQEWSYTNTSQDLYSLMLKQTVTGGVVRYNFSMVNNGTTYNDVLVLDRGNVGIGTSTPQAPLHVIAANSSDNALIQEWSYNNTSQDWYSLMLKQTVTGGVVRYNFSMVNNGTTYNDVLVLDRGNVGIGTTSPGNKLSVEYNKINVAGISIKNLATGATTGGLLETINDEDVSGTIGVLSSTYSNPSYPAFSANGMSIYSPNNLGIVSNTGYIAFQTTSGSNKERMRIDSNGNVGIGTTSPSAKLQSVGSVWADSTQTNTVFSGLTGADNANFIGSDGYWALRTSTNNAFNLDVYNSGSPLAAMTVLQNGNVGIGTTNPVVNLVVSNNGAEGFEFIPAFSSNMNIFMGYNRSTSTYTSLRTDFADYRFTTGGPERVRINSAGNVGIGTTSPLLKLVVSNSGAEGFEFAPAFSSNLSIFQGYNRSTNVYTSLRTDFADYRFTIGGTERVRIDSAGNVGIGISSTSSRLHVYGSGENQYLTIQNASSNFQAALQLATATTNANWIMYIPGSSNDLRLYNGADKVVFYQNGSTQLNGTLLMNNQAITGVYSIQQNTSTKWKFDQNGDGYVSDTFGIGRTSVITETGHSFHIQGLSGGNSIQLDRTSIGGTATVLISNRVINLAYWFGIIQPSTGTPIAITSTGGTLYTGVGFEGRTYTVSAGNSLSIYRDKTDLSTQDITAARTAGSLTYSVTLFVIWR